MEKLSMQTRVILAALLSFGFFILFDNYYVKDIREQQKLSQTIKQSNENPIIDNSQNTQSSPPSMSMSNEDSNIIAPVSEDTQNIIATITAKDFDIYIDDKARISNVLLKGKKFGEDGLKILDDGAVKPLELRFSNKALNKEAFNTKYQIAKSSYELINKTTIVLTQKLTNLTITKTITFLRDGSYVVNVSTTKNVDMFITSGYRPSAENDAFVFNGSIIKNDDDTLTMYEDGDVSANENFSKASLAGSVDKYYTSLFYSFRNDLEGVISTYKDEDSLVFVKLINNRSLNGYIGEKNYAKLNRIDSNLVDIIDYGFITFFAKPLFQFLVYIHSFVNNWGWSIILLTIVIKLLVFPLTYKGMMSMGRLKEITPQIKEIQAKHKGDPAKSGSAMMALYKKHNASPMGGCLPILLQIPVFFAIYRVLLNAVELKGAEWILWIEDLALHDPYFILPILMGGSMFVQQLITPTTLTDPTQQKIFKFLPVIFTIFFLTFPSGLVLYWIINNLLSIIQQFYINKKIEFNKIQREQNQR